MTSISKYLQLVAIGLFALSLTACGSSSPTPPAPKVLTASFTASTISGKAPLLVNFDASASSPADNISNYIWTFGDGKSGPSNPTSSNTYTAAGEYTVTLQISDGTSSASINKIITVAPENLPPVASFTLITNQPRQPAIASFDASASSDADGEITQFSWDFGDGSNASSGETTTHTYTQGTYTATLTITDSDGATSTATKNVTIAGDNLQPTASFTSLVNSARNVSFNAAASNDSDGSIQSYAWNFGDGVGTGANPSHTFSVEGSYNVSLIVTDNEGLESLAFSSSITVWNTPTRIVIIGDSISQGSPGNPSYRYRFWKKLIDSGKAFDLVGTYDTIRIPDAGYTSCSTVDCPDYAFGGHTFQFDPHHEATWGLTADEIHTNLSGIIGTYNYDIALIHLGTNDLLKSQTPANAKSDLEDIIATLRTGNANVKIAIAQIIPMGTFNTGYDQVTSLNGLIGSLVSESTTQSPIIIVDQHSGFSASADTQGDGVHPNASGEEKIATTWFNYIGPNGNDWIP